MQGRVEARDRGIPEVVMKRSEKDHSALQRFIEPGSFSWSLVEEEKEQLKIEGLYT